MKKLLFFFFLVVPFLAKPHSFNLETDPCSENEYPFIGIPETTLCEQYENLIYDIEIGAGTLITHSYQLGNSYTGNVCIKGDFIIDNSFKFIDCIVKIDPGVTIFVNPPHRPYISHIFTIDNSKLFACDDLWNGIVLASNTAISTKNNTVIEDALVAIKADNTQNSTLLIENTTFNRDQIGILLVQDPSLSTAATIARFNSNRFLCTSPLNGTTDQITFAGIKTVGVPFTLNPLTEAYVNLFQGLQYGIVTEGMNTTISGRFFWFDNIRRDGIHMDEGSLILRQSFWHNCEEKGVNIGLAHLVDIRENCRMTINTDITPIDYPNYRTGVYIDAFGLNSTVILDFNFSADLESTNTPVRGVHLKGGNVGAGTNISIVQSSFSIHAKSSAGIFLDGSFPASSETHIFANSFATGNDGGGAFSYGVHMVGNKNNLNIYGNYFTGNGYTNYAIWGQSSNGINNYISDNYLEGYLSTSGDYFSFGFGFINFQNATICSNTNYFGSNNAFIFLGTDPGIDFRENKVYATAVALRIEPNSLIGPQAHNGNEWHPIVVSDPPFTITFRAAYHALCQPESADDNKFTVHTNQSIWNDVTSSYDFFSKFHPENIEPDIMDEFFAIQSGTPSSACITLLSESGDNELDKTIADGLLQIPSANPSMDWITKSYLYKKMKANPDFVDDYISYPTFLSDNANTNIGRFYEVSKKIENAFLPNDSLDVKSQEILGNINSLVGDLNQIDSLLETSTDEGEILSLSVIKSGYQEQVRNLQVEYDSVYETYWVEIVLTLQEAQVLNQQIMPTDQLESNEKAVTDIWLESVLNQGDSLTASQISELKSIGEQCPETGGLAVSYALGLLPECEKVGLDICTPEVVDDVLPLSFIHKGGQSLVDPPSSFKKSWLFPNPSTSVFYVEIPGGEAGELMITDLAKGKVIIRQPIESGIRVEVNQPLAPGVYLVKIRTTKGMEFTDKLIIQSK